MSQPATHRQRIGFNVRRGRASQTIDMIRQVERAGIDTIWTTMGATGADSLTTFAAAAVQIERVNLGTSIVPAFTRHPLGLATQALALDDLAPGRVRIGIGTSHGPTMRAYGFEDGSGLQERPLDWLREYLIVARRAIQQGRVTFFGRHFQVDVEMSAAVRVPVLISALRPNAWELAGELSDGGISWLCPTDYLLNEALPAMQRGAERAGRSRPPLVAHIPVGLGADREAVHAGLREFMRGYTRLPFYARMFATSGYPVEPGGDASDSLIDHLAVSGSETEIAARLRALLADGLDELLVMLVPLGDQAEEERRLLGILGGL